MTMSDGDDFALHWPVRDERDAEPIRKAVETQLDWEAHADAHELPPAELPPALPTRRDASASGFRIRLRSSPASGKPAEALHEQCREEIERLEGLVAELRAEITALHRRAKR